MTTDIKSTNLELTPSIKQYAEEKLAALGKFIEKLEANGEAKLVIEIARTTNHHHRGDVYYAEANLNVKGSVIRAEHTDEDIYASIDKVKDILKMEIEKYKDKFGIDKQVIRNAKSAE